MHTLPQELEVWYIIPAVRKELANCMIKNYKLTYEKTANILGITKAAISQYVKNKRATKIKLHEKAVKEVYKSCKLIINEKSNATKEIMHILKFIRDKKLPCKICKNCKKGVLENWKEIIIDYDV